MHRLTLLLVLGGLVLAGCQDDRPLAPGEGPLAAISDGAHSGGNPDFFFLPPLVGDPSSDPNFDPGMFNGRLHPVLSIYADPSDGCDGALTYGPAAVPVAPDEETYQLDWDTDAANLTVSTTYRLCVFSSLDDGTMLGFVDLLPVTGGMKNVRTEDTFAFQDGRIVPVKFRIEQGALSYDSSNPDALGTEFTVDDEGGVAVLADETQSLAAVAVPAGAVPEGTEVTIVIAQEEPLYTETGTAECLPGGLLQSNWCYQIRTEPELYQFAESVRVEICVDVSEIPDYADDLLIHKYNETEGLVALPWAEPTLIGADCSGMGQYGATPGFFGRLGQWARRLLAPPDLLASVLIIVPKGLGGTGGSFSDFGGAVPAGPLTEPLAFASNRSGNWELYAMNVDGTALRRLTYHASADGGPAVSPDGQQIAFVSDRSGNLDIWIMSIDGTAVRQLTTNPARDTAPAWSPDGTQIVFHRHVGDYLGDPERPIHHVFTVNLDGTGEVDRLTGVLPRWSPDGSRFVFSKGGGRELYWGDIYVANLDGTGVVNLTNHEANDTKPVWSPDGQRIAFASNRAKVEGGVEDFEIWVMNADGSGVTCLTNTLGRDARPDWSPDGQTIAFMSYRSGNPDIWTMHADGSDQVNRSAHPAADADPALRQPPLITPSGIILDGFMTAGEWDQADHYTLDITLPNDATTTADIYVTNDATNLLFAVRFNVDISGWGTNIGVRIDDDSSMVWDGGADGNGDDGFVAQDYVSGADMFFDEFFDVELSQGQRDDAYGGTNDGIMAAASTESATVVEMSHPLMSTDPDHDAQIVRNVPDAATPFLVMINLPQAGPTRFHRLPSVGWLHYHVR
jgi:Tol biopolymer transport system component